jgi:hypothetical protein
MREVISGLALMLGGAAYAIDAVATLPLGTLRRMGPGMFPVGLGGLLFLIGVGVFVPALVHSEKIPPVNARALVAVLAGVVAFAMLIGSAGLFTAILVSTVLSSLAVPGNRPLSVLLLSLGLMVFAWAIFILILNLPIALWPWGL